MQANLRFFCLSLFFGLCLSVSFSFFSYDTEQGVFLDILTAVFAPSLSLCPSLLNAYEFYFLEFSMGCDSDGFEQL